MNMTGKELAEQASSKMAELSKNICDKNNLEVGNIDIFIPHQANYLNMP